MDDSQSSDVFSSCGDQQMDTVTYEYLVSNTKLSLSKNVPNEVKKSSFTSHFVSVLNDCSTCITQSLELVIAILSERNMDVDQLLQYLDDAVNILRLLSGFITSVLESVSMCCSTMKTFPSTTGRIIMAVFSHCRDSESLYGNHLKTVERQLKGLFRNCHELQLTYLMVLEKHFIFDLTECEELDVLVEALNINLQIGQIVQTLDVKTMAEQWKAFMMICEKYADTLTEKDAHHNCSKVLRTMIENNIQTAMEANQEDKIVLRSLKVASFTLKILFKVITIFKHATEKNYEHILELLLYTYQLNSATLETLNGKSSQLINLVNTNVTIPSDAVLKELLQDDKFIFCISNVEVRQLSTEKQLGYICIIAAAMRSTMQGAYSRNIKIKLTECLFKWLPYGHTWLNMNIKFSTQQKEKTTYGLYEYLITHMYALVSTFNTEEFAFLEHKMLESLLGTNCYRAMFASNLWELLTSIIPSEVLYNQVIFLCDTYEKLNSYQQFKLSPQKVHLSATISRLFNTLKSVDKTLLYSRKETVDLSDYKNILSVVKVKNMPPDAQKSIENEVLDKLKEIFDHTSTNRVWAPSEIDGLTRILRICATFSFDSRIERTELNILDEYIVKAWMKVCPANKPCVLRARLDNDSLWFLQYIQALVSLTLAKGNVLQKTGNRKKIFHVVSGLIQQDGTELKLALTELVGLMSLQYNTDHVTSMIENLVEDNDQMVRSRIDKIKKSEDKHIDMSDTLLMENLEAAKDFKYSHQCLEGTACIELNDTDSVQSIEKTCSNASKNFDFADIDSLFESGSESEPASKRVKLDTNNIEEILTRLENDASILCNVKENVVSSYKDRITAVCEKLKNILN